MNTETQTQRLESGKVRLIDANALLEKMNIARKDRPDSPDDLSDYGFWITEKILETAPTVDVSEIQEKAWKYDSLCK